MHCPVAGRAGATYQTITELNSTYSPDKNRVIYTTTSRNFCKQFFMVVGLPSNASRQKIFFLTNQRGYDKSETTDEKLSARRI